MSWRAAATAQHSSKQRRIVPQNKWNTTNTNKQSHVIKAGFKPLDSSQNTLSQQDTSHKVTPWSYLTLTQSQNSKWSYIVLAVGAIFSSPALEKRLWSAARACMLLAAFACTHLCMTGCLFKFYGDCLIKKDRRSETTQRSPAPDHPPAGSPGATTYEEGRAHAHLLDDHFNSPCPGKLQSELQPPNWTVTTIFPKHMCRDTVSESQWERELQHTGRPFVLHHSSSSCCKMSLQRIMKFYHLAYVWFKHVMILM